MMAPAAWATSGGDSDLVVFARLWAFVVGINFLYIGPRFCREFRMRTLLAPRRKIGVIGSTEMMAPPDWRIYAASIACLALGLELMACGMLILGNLIALFSCFVFLPFTVTRDQNHRL